MSIRIHENGFWEDRECQGEHSYDPSLGESLTHFFIQEKATSLVDLGCGRGDYVKTFQEHELNASGFDGNPYTVELTNNRCQVLDLSKPIQFDPPFDWVISLEVGEHLPPQFEDVFINNLHHNNRFGIVLSWAIQGQGGLGHYNEQNNDTIKSKICALGYTNDMETENNLRQHSSLPWFKNTIMVFRKIMESE